MKQQLLAHGIKLKYSVDDAPTALMAYGRYDELNHEQERDERRAQADVIHHDAQVATEQHDDNRATQQTGSEERDDNHRNEPPLCNTGKEPHTSCHETGETSSFSRL